MKQLVLPAVAFALFLSTEAAQAAPIYASGFERMIYGTQQCYLETFEGATNLGDPGLLDNLLGASDDLVLGWRNPTPIDGFVIGFDRSLMDGPGDDLVIRDYGPGDYTVSVSTVDDDEQYVQIAEITAGEAMVFAEYGLDFGGLDDINYVKITRTAYGPSNGRFFDSFAGVNPVPEPCTLALLMLGGVCILTRRSGR